MTCMRKPSARRATSEPMRPSPTTPSTLPKSSTPWSRLFSQRPPLSAASAAGTRRARAADDLELLARRQHGARDLGGAADDQALVLADARDERRLRERRGDIDLEPVLAERVDADGVQAVSDEDPLHDFSAKIFCAARTLEPKSTGWPSSASTCSRADSATTTSNSAA